MPGRENCQIHPEIERNPAGTYLTYDEVWVQPNRDTVTGLTTGVLTSVGVD